MYQLVSAIAKPLSGNGRWINLDIGNIPLTQLYSSYKKVIATLSNPALLDNVSLNIEQLRAELGASSLTFNQWLVDNSNKTLPTIDTLPAINTRYAHYADAFHAGYDIQPVHPTAAATSDMPPSERTYLRLTRPNTDYDLLYNSCLVNVNGFYHQTDRSADAVYVVDAVHSSLNAHRNEIGLYSFRELGKLTFIPIKDEMIYTQNDRQTLRTNCYVNTGVDLSTKTVMLVLGGYLHILDSRTFTRVSESAFRIDFNNLPLIDRYYESRGVLNLDSLLMEKSQDNPYQISLNDLYSDAVLRRYLTLSQSFFVALDNSDIFVEERHVQPSRMAGIYRGFDTPPKFPLVLGAGRHETYWYKKEDGQWSIHVSASSEGRRYYDTAKIDLTASVSDQEQMIFPKKNSPAKFLIVGTDI